jgi:hypothetical protein
LPMIHKSCLVTGSLDSRLRGNDVRVHRSGKPKTNAKPPSNASLAPVIPAEAGIQKIYKRFIRDTLFILTPPPPA